jgi:YD repeat-containing protein
MNKVTFIKSGLLWCGVFVLLAFVCASQPSADQAQYFYDELGRLVGVVDGQNNAAVYNYDAVGNLLSIQRFNTSGAGVGIFLVTPGSSLVNKPVEIRGFGFTSPPSSNQVAFNGTTASVVSGTDSALIVTVPAAATTGTITVTNSNGNATSPSIFTVLVPPIISGVDPPQVPKGGTRRVYIEGFNLQAASSVQFVQAGLTATIQPGGTASIIPINLAITAAVPDGSYPFSVTTPGGTAQSGSVTISVTNAVPSFAPTAVLTIQMPLDTTVPATKAPTGATFNVSPPTTVQMP